MSTISCAPSFSMPAALQVFHYRCALLAGCDVLHVREAMQRGGIDAARAMFCPQHSIFAGV